MHDIEIPAQKQHAHNGARLVPPLEETFHFFLSTLQLNKTDVLIIKQNNDKLQRMTTQNVHNNILFMLIFE